MCLISLLSTLVMFIVDIIRDLLTFGPGWLSPKHKKSNNGNLNWFN